MRFTNHKRFAEHISKQLKSHLVETIGNEIESRARSNNNVLVVSMKDTDHDTIQEVQYYLRNRGWTIHNHAGSDFKVCKT